MQSQLLFFRRSLPIFLAAQFFLRVVATKAELVSNGEGSLERTVSADEVFYGKTIHASNAAPIWADNREASFDSEVVDSAWSNQFAASESNSSITSIAITNINWRNEDVTLTGSGVTVLNLQNFILKGGTLTLDGTAATSFIINVRKQFSLSNGAKVVLAGGIQASSVVFNVFGKHGPVVVGDGSLLTGQVVALHRAVRVSDFSTIVGWVTAKKTKLVRGGKIIPPPVVSP
jgi:hypothetical protein